MKCVLPASGCVVHVSCAVYQKLHMCWCIFCLTLGPKLSRVWQVCGAACCHAYNLDAVKVDFVVSQKHMDLNEDLENAGTEVLPVVC